MAAAFQNMEILQLSWASFNAVFFSTVHLENQGQYILLLQTYISQCQVWLQVIFNLGGQQQHINVWLFPHDKDVTSLSRFLAFSSSEHLKWPGFTIMMGNDYEQVKNVSISPVVFSQDTEFLRGGLLTIYPVCLSVCLSVKEWKDWLIWYLREPWHLKPVDDYE